MTFRLLFSPLCLGSGNVGLLFSFLGDRLFLHGTARCLSSGRLDDDLTGFGFPFLFCLKGLAVGILLLQALTLVLLMFLALDHHIFRDRLPAGLGLLLFMLKILLLFKLLLCVLLSFHSILRFLWLFRDLRLYLSFFIGRFLVIVLLIISVYGDSDSLQICEVLLLLLFLSRLLGSHSLN